MPDGGYAVAWRRATSWARTSSPTPPRGVGVPVKYSSTSSWERPSAWKTWAPRYDITVEMPILDITLRTPLPSALIRLATAFCLETVTTPSSTSRSADSIAR